MKRLVLIPLLFLAACQSGVQTGAAPGDRTTSSFARDVAKVEDPCGADAFQHLVGTSADQIQSSMFPAGSRVLRPGMVMTMDYRGERLNVVIGESGKVDRVYCG
jgi:Peptidase inhibitor I78 family.